jgi:uncharacterized protein YbaA (DUF1428 family)
MPQYVDGFIVPVPKKNVDSYRRLAQKAGKIWREYGALEFRECVAEDVKVGKLTSFPRSVLRKPGETVFFSWIVYKSRADRDRINAKVMKDPRLGQGHALRCQAYDLWRLRGAGRGVGVRPSRSGTMGTRHPGSRAKRDSPGSREAGPPDAIPDRSAAHMLLASLCPG